MKFEKEEPEFTPVTITLESREEVMVLGAALAKTSVSVSGYEDFLYNLYRHLVSTADYDGSFRVTKDLSGIRVVEY